MRLSLGPVPRGVLLRWCGWFLLANWALLLVVATRYLEHMTAPETAPAIAFTVLGFAGHFASLAFLPMLLLAPLALLWPRRWVVQPLAVAIGAALLFVIASDTVVFANYRFHINGMVVGLLFGGAAGEIFDFGPVMWALMLGGGAAILAGEALIAWLVWRGLPLVRRRRLGVAAAVVLVGAFLAENALFAWASAVGYTPVTRQAHFLPGFQPTSMRKLMIALGAVPVTPVEAATMVAEKSGLNYPTAPMRCAGPERPLNVLFLVVDSWRFDALGPEVTPNMHRLARDAWRFENHFSGGNETRTGIFSLFYGIPATYWHAMVQEQRGPVLMQQFLEAGYEPAIFASAKLTSPEFDRTVFAAVPDLRTESEGERSWERDRDITSDFLANLDELEASPRPFFGFLFYDSPHGRYATPPSYERPFRPYLKRVNWAALDKETNPEPFFNLYKNSVHFVDSLAGQVLDALESRGLLESTIVILTGDHAEEFNDNDLNYWGHSGNFTRYQVQVPLVIRWPGREPKTFTHRTGHVDVAPTLLTDLFRCENRPDDYSTGRHLLNESPRDFLLISAYEQFGLVEPERITVYYYAGLMESYDARQRPLKGASVSPEYLGRAMERISRFYAR